ncbi:MAG: ATP-binding protein [Humidesulfovibrio sp.]|nr:ATP-binding protein [Humidesulfovibrio sp.]
MAIAKRILEEHGGYIHLKPSDKQGATFVLVLPLREKVWLRS